MEMQPLLVNHEATSMREKVSKVRISKSLVSSSHSQTTVATACPWNSQMRENTTYFLCYYR